mgnify:FL=1|tara:strand:- start:26 stop:295 length:270 start_codon:yes stop_codon:yes gene_type:complete
MSSPFDDEVFVNAMEAILKISKNSSNGLLGRMETTDKDKNPILYYSYDSALSYLTYKTLKEDFDESDPVIQNLIKRVKSNIEIIKENGN